MSQVYCKLAIIKNLLKYIESECEVVMFLHEDSGNRQCDYQESMMMQAYLEIIQHVVNMSEVPENVCYMRAILGPGDHVTCVELYSTVRALTFENFGLEFVWSTTQE